MKILEGRPRSYDRRMNRLSGGRVLQMKRAVASEVPHGSRVLEIGCGTGELAEMLCAAGCTVEGFDLSPQMLEVARERISRNKLGDTFEARLMGVEGMDELATAAYQAVVATLVLSELSDDERRFALGHSSRVLEPGGLLVLADEVVPRSPGRRLVRRFTQAPLRMISYLATRATVRPLLDPAAELVKAGFDVVKEERRHGDSFALLVGRKTEAG